jgi:hypothetical protein
MEHFGFLQDGGFDYFSTHENYNFLKPENKTAFLSFHFLFNAFFLSTVIKPYNKI